MTTVSPLVSDDKKLASVQKLCDFPNPYISPPEYEKTFILAMREICSWHQQKSKFYAKLCLQKGFDIIQLKSFRDLSLIPSIPADFFKLHEVISIPPEQIFLHLTSSGTTGQKSQVFFDEWSIKSAQAMVDRIFEYNDWVNNDPTNYLLYSFEPKKDSKLGTAYTDNFLCKYAPINKITYALKQNGNGSHDFDLFGCIRALEEYANDKIPVRIFGFPSFFHFTLERMKSLNYPPLKLNPSSLVFLGGGWKNHANQSIAKDRFYVQVTEQLGIPDERLRDGFGSVEHCIPYVECSAHNFHIPVWSKVVIRDFRNLNDLGYNKPGFLNFISPYITSMPAHSVMMGDSAILRPATSCSCKTGTDYFELLGRAGISKNKSCAIAASEILNRSLR